MEQQTNRFSSVIDVANKEVDEMMKNTVPVKEVVKGLVYSGQITTICAEPNCGKTMVMLKTIAELNPEEYPLVLHLNGDDGSAGGEVKASYLRERTKGEVIISLLAANPVEKFEQYVGMLNEQDDLSGAILILDTLTKFTDVMNKKAVKAFYMELRALTIKGATIVVLHHTNKYKDHTGQLVIGGVSDMKNDSDNVIMLGSEIVQGKTHVKSIVDKKRANISSIEFVYDSSLGEWLNIIDSLTFIEVQPNKPQYIKLMEQNAICEESLKAIGGLGVKEATDELSALLELSTMTARRRITNLEGYCLNKVMKGKTKTIEVIPVWERK